VPLEKARPILIAVVLGLSLAGCASEPLTVLQDAVAPAPLIGEGDAAEGAALQTPREIQLGLADMVIQRVEPSVSREEVFAAIEPLIAAAPVCMRWPALWMENVDRRSFVVRYDLMARDWGESSAAQAEARMDEFVESGFLTKAPGSNNDRAVSYQPTAAGEQYLSGVIEPGRRPRFCAPAERRLVEITSLDWGDYPCGSLHVAFTHIGDDWPSWAGAQALRERLSAAAWPPIGEAREGSVSLARQWFGRASIPAGFVNGSLRSACYDARRQAVVGDDLNLALPQID
jgi:hypothetical protein